MKLAIMRIFTPWTLANTTVLGFVYFFVITESVPELLNFHQHNPACLPSFLTPYLPPFLPLLCLSCFTHLPLSPPSFDFNFFFLCFLMLLIYTGNLTGSLPKESHFIIMTNLYYLNSIFRNKETEDQKIYATPQEHYQ